MLCPFACRCVLLGVVVVKRLSQLPAFLLFLDRRRIAQPWMRLHSSSTIVGATQAHYKWSPKSYGLYPSHDALQVPTLSEGVAHYFQHGRNNSHHCWLNNVGSCCVRLHVALGNILWRMWTYFLFLKRDKGPQEFNFRRNRLHLTNWAGPNRRDKVFFSNACTTVVDCTQNVSPKSHPSMNSELKYLKDCVRFLGIGSLLLCPWTVFCSYTWTGFLAENLTFFIKLESLKWIIARWSMAKRVLGMWVLSRQNNGTIIN